MRWQYKPKVKQFDVNDFVYFQRQLNDTLDIFLGRTILRIKAIRPLGVLELQEVDGCIIQDHSKNCVPYHLPNLDLTIITSTWIFPLVRYVKGQTMLIRCCFVIIVMVWIPSILLQVGTHSSSQRHLVLFIMFSCNTLISTRTMPCFPGLKSRGGYIKFSFQPPLMHCIHMCMHSFLVD
jgi:hypothetical protein